MSASSTIPAAGSLAVGRPEVRRGHVAGTSLIMSRRWGALIAAALVTSLVACAPTGGTVGPTTTGEGGPRSLLFLAPGPEASPPYLPAFRGAEVALAVAALDGVAATITWVELPEDLDAWEAPVADGAIVAPWTPPSAVDRLASLLGVPTVSLAGGVGRAWRSLASGEAEIAVAMLRVAGATPCLVVGADAHGFAARFHAGVVRTAPARLRAGAVLRDPSLVAGCTAVLWPGSSSAGARLRMALVAAGRGAIPFVATDRVRDGAFAAAVGRAGLGVLVVSAAVDVATRLDLRSRRFVQDYQAQVGLAPAPFSVEGWDAASLLLAVLEGGWPSDYTGIGGRYELDGEAPAVIAYRLGPGGWRPR